MDMLDQSDDENPESFNVDPEDLHSPKKIVL
jgi:hypothetical protein